MPCRIRTKMLLAGFAILAVQPAVAQDDDRRAIKETIRKETASFYQRDPEGWQSAWLHEADVTRTIISGASYYSVVGWENFGPGMVDSLKENPQPLPLKFTNDNFILHVGGDLAWAEYDQTLTTPLQPDFKRQSRERRVLKKRDDQWKIVAQITVDPETFGPNPDAVQLRLNAEGQRMLQAGKVQQAIEVLSVNVRLHPDAWLPHELLGAALAAAGNKDRAIEHYETSLKLNPNNERVQAALAKLKGA